MRGGWGRGGVPTPSGTDPWLRGQQLGGHPRGWRGGMEGNVASTFSVHLGTSEPVGLPGLILLLRSLLPAVQSPSLAPTPHPGTYLYNRRPPLRAPPTTLGLNPTHTPSPRALPPTSGPPHSRPPPLEVLPLPFCADPKQSPCPTFEWSLPRPRPQGLFQLHGS